MMRAHPTDRALPSFYLGTSIHQPTIIIDGSTVHVVLTHHDACLAEVANVMQTSSPSRSYLMVEINDDLGGTLALHWYSERKDANGHRHILQLVEAIENVRAENSGHSESSIGKCTEHLLADSELARFGLTTGSLVFEGTRTVQVWRAHLATCGAVTPVTRVFVETGVHCYLWLQARQDDDVGELFPTLDGHPSVDAW